MARYCTQRSWNKALLTRTRMAMMSRLVARLAPPQRGNPCLQGGARGLAPRARPSCTRGGWLLRLTIIGEAVPTPCACIRLERSQRGHPAAIRTATCSMAWNIRTRAQRTQLMTRMPRVLFASWTGGKECTPSGVEVTVAPVATRRCTLATSWPTITTTTKVSLSVLTPSVLPIGTATAATRTEGCCTPPRWSRAPAMKTSIRTMWRWGAACVRHCH
mmetsp:Transcript_9791/g.26430  ORF Transcript_9791/g.26430 Transcript_9791/m.26430 type:complete len:217 (+) Transcript_9791:640-1290(+)